MALDLPPLPLYERVFGTAWMKWLRVLRDRLVLGENWQFVTFQNSWTDYNNSYGRYYKDALGIVHLRGRIAGGAVPSIAFTLPEGYRPERNTYFPATASGYTFGTIAIGPLGNVSVLAGSTVWTSLDGVSFKAL